MAAAPSVDWLARGRRHADEGRHVDALLCLQRAVRASPGQAGPRLHLGLALAALGRERDAVAVWREAAVLDPADAGIALALAQALLAQGDAAGARDAVAAARRAQPGDPRAQALEALAEWLAGDGEASAASLLSEAIARAPELLADAAVAVPLARALDLGGGLPGSGALLQRVLRHAEHHASMPAALLALAAEAAAAHPAGSGTAIAFAEAQRRDFAPGDHEALRRIARAAARAHSPWAPALARRYGELCVGACRPQVALAWPLRTSGARLRVIALVEPRSDDPVAAANLAALAALPPARFDVGYAAWSVSPASTPSPVDRAPPAPCVVLDGPVDAQARRLAALDADALVDLVGLEGPGGALLAARPARSILAPEALRAPPPAPLCDRWFATAADLTAHLDDAQRALPAPPAGLPDAAGMAALWDDAVRKHRAGDPEAAGAGYDRVLELQPGFAPAHFLRGVSRRERGDLAGARADFARALAIAPGYHEARVAAANAAMADGQPQEAAALCAAGAAFGAPSAALLRCWGLAELAQHRGAAAEAQFARALALEPTDGDTHYNHGVALQMRGDAGEAARAYQRALAFAPHLIAADFNLGVLFQQQGATDAAAAAYRTVLAQDPRHAAAYRNLGETLLAAGRAEAALESFRRFEANCPESLALAVQALEVLQHHGDFDGIDRYLDGLARERFRAADDAELCDALEQLLYLLLFFDVDPGLVFSLARRYDAALRRLLGPPLPARAARRPGRIRIGYLSADLRGHVMGKMIWQEAMHHDRTRFALHFYALSTDRDEWTRGFERIAESFVALAGATDAEAAARIRDDDLDLLVDLSTHTRGARPGILALKPARVQITHVASAGTVGLATIDFKLTDALADLPGNQRHQLETLLPVDGCVYPYRHVAPAAEHPFRREALGIAAADVLIGAFFTPLKLSRRCLALWREVLERVPRARIAFSPANPAFRESYVRLARAGGIPAERLLFVPQGRDDAESQARYALIDLVLDPMPYGGVNGTLEALDMAVPVVTLVGSRHGERTSYSMLANLGVERTIARSGREYVELAVRLATDRAWREETRAAIRAGLAGSKLTDARAHARSVEAAYLRALALRAPEVALPEGG